MDVALSVIRNLERNAPKLIIMNECRRKDYRKMCCIADHQKEKGHPPSIHDMASMEDLGLDDGNWNSKSLSKPKTANP
jgi:hypothetical protein